MVIETPTLPSNSHPPWINACNNLAMKALSHRSSLSEEAWMPKIGKRSSDRSWMMESRQLFCSCQGKRVEIISMMKSRNSSWLNTLYPPKWYFVELSREERTWDQSSTRFSYRLMLRLEVSLGLWTTCHSWTNPQWFVAWTCSTPLAWAKNPFSPWLPLWIKLQQSIGPHVSFKTTSDKRLHTHFRMECLRRWKHLRR